MDRGALMAHLNRLPDAVWQPIAWMAALSVLGHIISLVSPRAFSVLSLSPSSLFTMELWRLVTAAFVGHDLILFAASLGALHATSRLTHRGYNTVTLLKTFLLTQLCTSAILCILAYILYATAGSSYLLYDTLSLDLQARICGMGPIIAALLVAEKQFLPDSIVLATPAGRIKFNHLPINGILISAILALISFIQSVVFFEVLIGTQVAWTYLRFYAPHETDAVFGDSSDHFAWPTLFPSSFRPACTLVARMSSRTLARAGLCNRQVRHIDVGALLVKEQDGLRVTDPSAVQVEPVILFEDTNRDVERRRKKALAQLQERMAAAARNTTVNTENPGAKESIRPQEVKPPTEPPIQPPSPPN